MPREEALPETEGAPAMHLPEAIPKIAMEIARLDPGPAAALRRGPRSGAGAAAFWKLLARYDPVGAKRNESGWAALIQAIAILTPKAGIPKRDRRMTIRFPWGRYSLMPASQSCALPACWPLRPTCAWNSPFASAAALRPESPTGSIS